MQTTWALFGIIFCLCASNALSAAADNATGNSILRAVFVFCRFNVEENTVAISQLLDVRHNVSDIITFEALTNKYYALNIAFTGSFPFSSS
jgi:hypothetical protein